MAPIAFNHLSQLSLDYPKQIPDYTIVPIYNELSMCDVFQLCLVIVKTITDGIFDLNVLIRPDNPH